ncbi:hypothetical protein BU25DRAFT_201174 [Macroventuria anomochaeta]|uniref:Uncharacterized protein n=1 Tax=Macroventuria anomochaeta TaxID=301207 RepID=A0ACB6RLQ9_9PLEO|nr:uncharacterized protein BU25DRAFT_201174 [Macroventuria anomochaeta]KAF2622816.1 hypothetical protein BU25DRAFT_201174 [Macroventuria anomochaeta]
MSSQRKNDYCTMSAATTTAKSTLWIWPSGLFPRRLIYYFRAKHVTLSTLSSHNIHLIPVSLTTSPPALGSRPGHEARPADSSLPIMRIEHADGRTVWIRESVSILEYFEELFPVSDGWEDLRGETAEPRARTRDVLSLLNDAMHWGFISLIHSDPRTTFWSGLSEWEMSPSTAAHAHKKQRFYLERLDRWLEVDGGQEMEVATLAGLVLLANVEYPEMMYGTDWVGGHDVLRAWVEAMKGEEWYVGNEELKGVERGEGWETLLGD